MTVAPDNEPDDGSVTLEIQDGMLGQAADDEES